MPPTKGDRVDEAEDEGERGEREGDGGQEQDHSRNGQGAVVTLGDSLGDSIRWADDYQLVQRPEEHLLGMGNCGRTVEPPEGAHVLPVPHVRQIRNWDCGVACVHMVLRFLDPRLRACSIDLARFGVTTSVWTIDLLRILDAYDVEATLCTTVCGARAEYAQESFYAAEFSRDEKRITELFESAHARNWRVDKRVVSLEELLQGVHQGHCAVVLVNSGTMRCLQCVKPSALLCACLPKKFSGHYIVLCGHDTQRKIVYYRDPSASATLCCTSEATFEASRHEFGTDDDVLMVSGLRKPHA